MDEEEWKTAYDVKKFKWDLTGLDLWKKMLTVPTLNIDGIKGGYIGEGSKTLLPHEVTVKMDIRLVPGMKPDEMLKKVRKHLDSRGFQDIEIEEYGKPYDPSSVPYHSSSVQTLKKTYELMGTRPQIWPWNRVPHHISCSRRYWGSHTSQAVWDMDPGSIPAMNTAQSKEYWISKNP